LQWLFGDQLFQLRPLMLTRLNIGTRGSELAMWQARWVQKQLQQHFPELRVSLVPIKTKGDKILDVPLAKVGGKGLFVKEIETALLEGTVDLAVHSMKDMPGLLPGGLTIGAVPERETPEDVLISRQGLMFDQLPKGGCVGTSSLRRGAQIRHLRADLRIVPLRGNLQTRLKKLGRQELDAIVLAAAGVKRLGLENRITQILPCETMLPAVGQGALCIEVRAEDPEVGPLVAELDHVPTHTVVRAERAFLQRLEGGCQVPIAAHGSMSDGQLSLTGLVADLDGTRLIRERATGPAEAPEDLGYQVAERLLDRGAGTLLKNILMESHGT
jgi:hydroxymethylbilane synthase